MFGLAARREVDYTEYCANVLPKLDGKIVPKWTIYGRWTPDGKYLINNKNKIVYEPVTLVSSKKLKHL